MKVYIYISQRDLLVFNGLLADSSYMGSGIKIEYFEEHRPGTLMVSMSLDTFIYFQDQEVLFQTELIQN
jgi:hypothetical protein